MRTVVFISMLASMAFLAVRPATARAGEVYYVMVFGSQSQPKQLRYTHTWATFIKATGEGTDPNTYALEYNTISWLPRTLDVKVLRPWAEPGVNLDLHQTLRAVAANDESVKMWGPFIVGPEVYRRSLEVQRLIASGPLATGPSTSGPTPSSATASTPSPPSTPTSAAGTTR